MKHRQLSLNLIDEGRLLRDFNDEFFNVQSQLMRHVMKYGEKSKGAKAKIGLEIELSVADPENGVSVNTIGKVKTSLPARPVSTTIAIGDETLSGKPTLSCRDLGSAYDSPHQGLLDLFSSEPLSDEVMAEED